MAVSRPVQALWEIIDKRRSRDLTGYESFVVEEAFVNTVAPLYQHSFGGFRYAAKRFFAVLGWIHMAPKKGQYKHVLGLSYRTFRRTCWPLLAYLRQNLNQVHWSDRLCEHNHTAVWPYYVTSVKDTGCMPIADSVIFRMNGNTLYGTKYHTTGLKFEVTCSLKGHIVDFKFPAGTANTSDFTIHNDRVASGDLVFEPWEICLGDGAYRGARHCLARYPRNFNFIYVQRAGRRRTTPVPLNPAQKATNRTISHDRQRIEHIVGLIQRHDLFETKFGGKLERLRDAVAVTMHMTNMKIKMCGTNSTAENLHSRYADTIGPWPHDLPDHINLQ